MIPKKALVRNRCARLRLIELVVPGRSHAKDEKSKKLWKHGFIVMNSGYKSDQRFSPLSKVWTERTAQVGGSKKFEHLLDEMRSFVVGKVILQIQEAQS